MVKLSPMLDWHKTVADFAGAVHEVHIVSTGNECKELLLVLGRGRCVSPLVVCANDEQVLSYKAGDNSDNHTTISDSAWLHAILAIPKTPCLRKARTTSIPRIGSTFTSQRLNHEGRML